MNKIKIIAVIAAAVLLAGVAYAGNAEAPKKPAASNTRTFIDENGDGICDNWATRPHDGTGNQYRRGNRQNNGGRYGRGDGSCGFGSGICDGTGPHGTGRRGGRG